jgi:hypothetical protein
MAEIVVERAPKDQPVFRPAARSIIAGFSSRFNADRIARRAGGWVKATAGGTFHGTNLA